MLEQLLVQLVHQRNGGALVMGHLLQNVLTPHYNVGSVFALQNFIPVDCISSTHTQLLLSFFVVRGATETLPGLQAAAACTASGAYPAARRASTRHAHRHSGGVTPPSKC